MFSDLAKPFAQPQNRLYQEKTARLARGQEILDLVSGNVTDHGIQFPEDVLRRALAEGIAKSKTYHPDPRGQRTARRAIEAFYRKAGHTIQADQILLTPGTSQSYGYLFRLLAKPGENILNPQPGYPLIDSIAALCGIQLKSYALREKDRWEIDFAQLKGAIDAKTRGIVLISPHNPTGSVATDEEIRELAQIASTHQLPIISDEVFCPFLLSQKTFARPMTTEAPLVFTLNGVSKMLALPGLKIGWIGVTGKSDHVNQAIKLLEMISDTLLPVSEPSQFALPQLMENSDPFQRAFQAEMRERTQVGLNQLNENPALAYALPEGGFYVTVRLRDPRLDAEEVAWELLSQHGLLIHPGHFYEMDDHHLVFSLVATPKVTEQALKKMGVYFG